jgi:hypothetical protein
LAAIAVLSSPTIYVGLIAGFLTWLLLPQKRKYPVVDLRLAGLAFAFTLVLGGSLLLSVPQGLAGVGEVLAVFFTGTGQIATSLGEFLFALLGYGFPALVFGGLGAIQAMHGQHPDRRAFATFAGLALLVAVVNPQRQVIDLVWTLIPLYTLAALWLVRYFQFPTEEPLAAYGESILVVLLSIFFFMTVARLAGEGPFIYLNPESSLPGIDGRSLILFFVIAVLAAATILIALGWSAKAVVQGLVWSLSLVFCALLLSVSTRLGRASTANDLWSPGPAAGEVTSLLKSLDDLSFWESGRNQAVAVHLETNSPSVAWALRDFPDADGASPPVVITEAGLEVSDELASYYGQSFGIQRQRTWMAWPPNFFRWLLFRDAPTQDRQIVLWVSPALFPGGDLPTQPVETTP